MPRKFKGWVVPGPAPVAIGEAGAGETLDSISGSYRIFQLREGHRFSTDDVLVAWYGTSWCPRAETVLDLGSGIGSVATVAAWRLPGARIVTVEAQSESVALARKSVRYNGLEERYEPREGDFRHPGVLREGERFDLVLGSPPYFPLDAGLHGDHPQKIACRFEARGDVADYARTAAQHLAPGGVFACVFPIEPSHQRERVFAAARAAELVVLRERPVALKEGDLPLLGLFVMCRQEDVPDGIVSSPGGHWIEPSLVIRRKDGTTHPEYALVKMSFGFPPT